MQLNIIANSELVNVYYLISIYFGIQKATFTFVHLVFLFSTFCSSVLKPDLQMKTTVLL